MHLSEARESGEGDRSVDLWTQMHEQARVDVAERALADLRQAARQCAIDLLSVRMLDIAGWPPRGSCIEASEVIEAGADEAEKALFQVLCNMDELAHARSLANGESDDE